MELAPGAQIFATPASKIYLPLITNKPMPTIQTVKDNETVDIGEGRTLTFLHAPFPALARHDVHLVCVRKKRYFPVIFSAHITVSRP